MKALGNQNDIVQVFSIPKDTDQQVKPHLYFVLLFDKEGTIDHDDHSGKHTEPKLPYNEAVGPSTAPKLYQAKANGVITIKIKPAKQSGAVSLLTQHTITIGDK